MDLYPNLHPFWATAANFVLKLASSASSASLEDFSRLPHSHTAARQTQRQPCPPHFRFPCQNPADIPPPSPPLSLPPLGLLQAEETVASLEAYHAFASAGVAAVASHPNKSHRTALVQVLGLALRALFAFLKRVAP